MRWQSGFRTAGLSWGTGMIKVTIVVGDRNRQGPSGPPVFELPAVPEIGSYITCPLSSLPARIWLFGALNGGSGKPYQKKGQRPNQALCSMSSSSAIG